MKKAFSTVACMECTYDEVVALAVKAGMQAVEIRLDDDGGLFGLGKEAVPEVKKCFKEKGIEISDLGTSVALFGYEEEKIAKAKECINLASEAGAAAIRIFLGNFAKRFSDPVTDSYEGIVDALKEICDIAEKCGIEIWVETHNAFSTGKVLAKLIEDVGCDNLKIIWDIIHPIEYGETPDETLKYLMGKIAHVHIKDGRHSGDSNKIDYIYTKLGEGELPVGKIVKLLEKSGYSGYLSLEWESAWRQEIRDEYDSIEKLLCDYNEFMHKAENNLLPEIGEAGWETETPPCKKIAHFGKGSFEESLNIEIKSKSFGVGKWKAQIPVEKNKSYDFTVSAQTACEAQDIYAIATVFRADGSMVTRDHIRNSYKKDGFIRFYDKIETDSEADSVKIELWLKGYDAKVKWYNPCLCKGEERDKREVGVAVAYIPPNYEENSTIEGNKGKIFYVLERSAKTGADIIVLSECMYERNVPNVTLSEAAQTDDGEMCSRISEKAAEYGAYIIYNFHEFDDGEYYNTSVLFDRKGKLAGKYRKTHLTVGELEQGMTPGDEYPIFDTDFGRIGMLICFDHYFSETSEILAEKGAEIIFVSSAGDAAEKCIARAMDTGIYFAVCGLNHENVHGWGAGRIVAPDGSIISDTEDIEKPAFAKIDLNMPVRREWLSLGPAMSEFYGVYRYEKNKHCKK